MMLDHMSAFPELAPYAENISNEDIQRVMRSSRVVNDREVLKESHNALLPTSNRPNPNAMTTQERNICLMIFGRLLEQFMPKFEADDTTLLFQHGDGRFIAKGSTVVNQGWRALFSKKGDASLPAFDKGDQVHAASIGPVERKTSPPKRLTQASLIVAIKNIASQIDDPQLKKSLQDSQGKDLIPTDLLPQTYSDFELYDDHCVDVWYRDDAPSYRKMLSIRGIGDIKFIATWRYSQWKIYIQLPYVRVAILGAFKTETAAMKKLRELIRERADGLKEFAIIANKYKRIAGNIRIGISNGKDVRPFDDFTKDFQDYLDTHTWFTVRGRFNKKRDHERTSRNV